MQNQRSVFFVSDGTGLTAESLGQSMITQFDEVNFNRITIPFVDSIEKANSAVQEVRLATERDGKRPIVFSTLVDPELRSIIHSVDALLLDFFEIFIGPLERELGEKSNHRVGRSHSASNTVTYDARIEAVNYTMAHDDGITEKNLSEAEVILVGVSRSGKTPTSLYMALQFGIKAANYPLIPEDVGQMKLPPALTPHKRKIYGLTILPERLRRIREERRPGSKYAALDNCRFEVNAADALMRSHGIPILNSTDKSIEEISTTILHQAHLVRRVF
jgi:[pyruvate, water dikinase]-phosphate phosphotransferase / [pyruvate, water dikinase] kinase